MLDFVDMHNIHISIHAPREGGDYPTPAARRPGGHFNPRPPRGGRPSLRGAARLPKYFNPRPPRGGRRAAGAESRVLLRDFNPRPPRGGRRKHWTFDEAMKVFQSTPPARGATIPSVPRATVPVFQSTPPARGATFRRLTLRAAARQISIHAPREGGDVQHPIAVLLVGISIHAPREGGDGRHTANPAFGTKDFNPRPPRGGRLNGERWKDADELFQSTPPARGATAICGTA